jgi:hypothetical protein
MSLCGTLQQQAPLVFNVVDNLNRPTLTIAYILREGRTTRNGVAT